MPDVIGCTTQRAGYAHVAAGPDSMMRSAFPATANDQAYLRAARWDRGETLNKQLNSGLIILSDYPIVAVDRIAVGIRCELQTLFTIWRC